MPDVLHELEDKGPGGIPVWGYGIVLAAGVIGYSIIKNRSASSTAAAAGSTAGTVTDPAGNVCAATNPATGYCPGTPQDIAAGGSTTGPDTSIQYDYSSPTYIGNEPPPYSYAPPLPATNSQWERAVVDWLVSKGETPGEADDATSDYLDGQSLSTPERRMIDLAEDFWGSPPQPIPVMTGPQPRASTSDTADTGDAGGTPSEEDETSGGDTTDEVTPASGPNRPASKAVSAVDAKAATTAKRTTTSRPPRKPAPKRRRR